MGLGGAVEHFLYHVVGAVQELLDVGAIMAGYVCRRLGAQFLGQLAVDPGHAIGIEDAPACCGIGNQHIDIATAQSGENCRNLVEATGDCDAHRDFMQHVERYADGPVIEGPDTGCP